MRIKKLGNFIISAIGQGTGGEGDLDDAQCINVLRCGISCGMTFIDTAEAYRNGRSEEIVGRAIKGERKRLFVATKFSPQHSTFDGVMRAIEGSLRRLNTDYIDLYQLHWPNPCVPIEETMLALLKLKESGKVLHFGLSNFSYQGFVDAQKASSEKIASNQLEYNLLERGIEEDFLPYAKQNDIMAIAYRPLLFPKKRQDILESMAEKYSKSIQQIILNWLLSHDQVVPIPRTVNLDHVRENAEAADFQLSDDDRVNLDEAFSGKVSYIPANLIRVLPSGKEKVYLTLEEALQNRFDLKPSPQELAKDILERNILKPVQVRPAGMKNGGYDYELIQGRIRFWAWIIAYGPGKPLPARIME